MRLTLALAAGLTLVSCSRGPDPKALERQYKIMQENGATEDELCAKGREIADAWLGREDRDKYQMAKLEADIVCNQAVLDRL